MRKKKRKEEERHSTLTGCRPRLVLLQKVHLREAFIQPNRNEKKSDLVLLEMIF
jgi:hypothetical protein